MIASVLAMALLPTSPLYPQDIPALTIVRDLTLPKELTDSWEASSDRRWLPDPQDAPYQYYAQEVFKNRWKIQGYAEHQRNLGPTAQPDKLEFHEALINDFPVAWTPNQDQVRFDQDANTVMAAWAYDFYGSYFRQSSWNKNARHLTDLWTYSPLDPTVFATEAQEFLPSQDKTGPAFSGVWALKWFDLHPTAEHPDLALRLALLADHPTDSPAQALFQSKALTSKAIPEEAKKNLASYLQAYNWPAPSQVEPKDLPVLVWAQAAEYSRTKSPQLREALLASTIALAKKQATTDNPDLPSQPTFGTVSLDNDVHSNNAPYAAIALCEAGAALQNAQFMERGVAAIRASFGQMRTGYNSIVPPFQPNVLGYQAYHSYGADGTDMYRPWTSFEECEGKILAATAYLTHRFGALYEVKKGEWVGIDCIRLDAEEPVDLLRNLTRPFQKPQPFRESVSHTGERNPLTNQLGRKQVIVDMLLVSIDPQPVVRVVTGTSVAGVDVYGEDHPLQLALNLPKGTVTPTIDQLGFSAPLAPDQVNGKITAVLKLNGWSYSRAFPVYDTPPLAANKLGAEGWTRFGQTPQLPAPARANDWVSTGRKAEDLFSPEYVGMIQTPVFFGKNRVFSFTVQGQGGATFQLLNPDNGQVLLDFEATEMQPTNVQWDLSLYPNQRLQLRLFDNTPSGFVEVKNLKLTQP